MHKVLAETGLGSRRNMEEAIKEGRVSVDGKIAGLGDRVEGTETIRVDGRIIKTGNQEKPVCRVLMYNKPEGQMCTRTDPQGRPTVFDRLPQVSNGRWIYVGRLDVNTSGLLLLTTDGALSNALTHPSREMERVYAVRVFGDVTPDHVRKLTSGVDLEDGPAHFAKVEQGGGEGMNKWFYVTLREGRKREVRRLWEALGFRVSRLKRIRYACVELGKLPEGGWRELTLNEVNDLRKMVGLAPESRTVLTADDQPSGAREEYLERRQMQKSFRRYREKQGLGGRNGGSRSPVPGGGSFRMRDAVARDSGTSFVSSYLPSRKPRPYIPVTGLNRDDERLGLDSPFAGKPRRNTGRSGDKSGAARSFGRRSGGQEFPVWGERSERGDRSESRQKKGGFSGKYSRSSENGERSRDRDPDRKTFRDAPRKSRGAQDFRRKSPARSSARGASRNSRSEIDF